MFTDRQKNEGTAPCYDLTISIKKLFITSFLTGNFDRMRCPRIAHLVKVHTKMKQFSIFSHKGTMYFVNNDLFEDIVSNNTKIPLILSLLAVTFVI